MSDQQKFQSMTVPERVSILLQLSESLHLSALVARSHGAGDCTIMEELADEILREHHEIAADISASADQVIYEAVRLLSNFELNHPKFRQTRR